MVIVVDLGGDAGAIAHELEAELPVEACAWDALSRESPRDAIHVLAIADAACIAGVIAWADRAPTRPGLIAIVRAQPDAEAALSAGVDDAVAGAITPRELAARVRAVDRRVRRAARVPQHLRYGALVLAAGDQVVWIDGAPHELSRMEFGVLRALVAAGGAAMSRAALLEVAWGARRAAVGERAVDNVIVTLRRKLGPIDRIRTVRGIGFRLTR
jgi:DNA-binding response OmpR family regulator